MYFYVFWELIYFYVICIYVIWETTLKLPLINFNSVRLHFIQSQLKNFRNYFSLSVLQVSYPKSTYDSNNSLKVTLDIKSAEYSDVF